MINTPNSTPDLEEDIYDKDYGHKIVTAAFQPPEIRAFLKAENEYFLEHISKDTKLVDFGCGLGRNIDLLKNRCAHIVGLDHTPSMIDECKKKFQYDKNVDIILSEVIGGFIPEKSFDYSICAMNTLGNNHGEEQIKFLAEMKRVTKIGGKIYVSLYSEKAAEVQKKFYTLVGLEVEKQDDNYVYTNHGFKSERFTAQKITGIFAKANLNQINIFPMTDIGYMVTAEIKN